MTIIKFPICPLALLLSAGALLPAGCNAAPAPQTPTLNAATPTAIQGDVAAPNTDVPRALWVWDATVITGAQQRKSLFDFCAQKAVSVIYVSVGDVFSAKQREVGDAKHVTAPMLAEFVRAAHAKNLQVEALDGDPEFALAANHAEALGILRKALAYNAAAAPDARLDGFQWDTEPYVLPAFNAGPEAQRALFAQYLDSMKEMRDAVAQTPNLRLSICIPWFFDGAERALDWNGASKAPSFHLLDLLASLPSGELVLMAYRDKATGSNGTIEISRGEIEYAAQNAPKVKVWIGQETLDVTGDPPSITFFQEGESALEDALGKINAAYSKAPSFGGVAIHHLESYRVLKPGEPIVAVAPVQELTVIAPLKSAKVARETFINGAAPVGGPGVKVAVAVKPQGDAWYDQGEAPVEADGSWSVRALFGGENTPDGAKFDVRVRLLAADGSVVQEQTVSDLVRANGATE